MRQPIMMVENVISLLQIALLDDAKNLNKQLGIIMKLLEL